MKILCPVDNAGEARSLAALGAGEFYGGLLSPEWEERFTLAASANRRSFPEAQIGGEEALREILDAVHESGGRFYLTLNAPFYTAAQMEVLLPLADRAVALGVDAVIAADIGLVAEAKDRWPSLPVHLSTLAEVSNSGAVDFYRHLGIGRITLPRHLTLGQVEAVVRASPGVGFDVFVLYGQCVNDEGHCTFSHDDPRRMWPCVQEYSVTAAGGGSAAGPGAPAVCGQMLWAGLPRGEACGLCAIGDLRRLGIEAVKIVGRGTSRERKEWAVRTVRSLLDLLDSGEDGEDFRREARRLYRERFPRGCRPALCYFPELLEGGDG